LRGEHRLRELESRMLKIFGLGMNSITGLEKIA
jgi:hypothetical protein